MSISVKIFLAVTKPTGELLSNTLQVTLAMELETVPESRLIGIQPVWPVKTGELPPKALPEHGTQSRTERPGAFCSTWCAATSATKEWPLERLKYSAEVRLLPGHE